MISNVEYRLMKYYGYKNNRRERGQFVIWYKVMGLYETLDILIIPSLRRSLDDRY